MRNSTSYLNVKLSKDRLREKSSLLSFKKSGSWVFRSICILKYFEMFRGEHSCRHSYFYRVNSSDFFWSLLICSKISYEIGVPNTNRVVREMNIDCSKAFCYRPCYKWIITGFEFVMQSTKICRYGNNESFQ